QYFRDKQECVYYRPDNLEELLAHYLEHEDERAALAEAARQKARSCSFEELWQQQIGEVEAEWPALRDRGGRPGLADAWQELSIRCWQALASGRYEDVSLIGDLERALAAAPQAASLANLIGCMLWRQGRGRSPGTVLGAVAAEHFRRALAHQP